MHLLLTDILAQFTFIRSESGRFSVRRLGFLVEFLSHAAIVGFMAGAAIVIGMQQLKALLGLTHFTNNTDVVSVVKAVYSDLHDDPVSASNRSIVYSSSSQTKASSSCLLLY
jgi:hypothetical protein